MNAFELVIDYKSLTDVHQELSLMASNKNTILLIVDNVISSKKTLTVEDIFESPAITITIDITKIKNPTKHINELIRFYVKSLNDEKGLFDDENKKPIVNQEKLEQDILEILTENFNYTRDKVKEILISRYHYNDIYVKQLHDTYWRLVKKYK